MPLTAAVYICLHDDEFNLLEGKGRITLARLKHCAMTDVFRIQECKWKT